MFSWLTSLLVAQGNTMKVLNQTHRQNRFSSFFSWLGQNCVNLSWWFLPEKAPFYTEHCTTPSLFKVSQGACSHSFKNYGFVMVCDSIFISTCNDHLATSTKIAVLEYNQYAWDQRTTVVFCCQLKRHLKRLRLAPTSLSMHNIWTSQFLFSCTPSPPSGWS